MTKRGYADDVASAMTRHPRLFDHLRSAGWTPDREVDWVDLPEDHIFQIVDAGFLLNDYAGDLLDNLQGLEVSRRYGDAPGQRNAFSIAVGPAWLGDHNVSTSIYIKQLVECDEISAVLRSGDGIGFVRPDGTAFLTGPAFMQYVDADDVFTLLDWVLYREPLDGLRPIPIPPELRPPSRR